MIGVRAFETARGRPWLARLDPRVKLAWVLAASVMSVMIDSRGGLIVLACLSAAVLSGVQMRPTGWWLVLGTTLAVVWATILSQGLFYQGEPRTIALTIVRARSIGSLNVPAVELVSEGLSYGLVQSLRFVAMMLLGIAVALSTSPERLLAALVWYRVPPAVAFLTTTALRFLPVVLDEWSRIRLAMRMRGHRLHMMRAGQWLEAELAAFVPLLSSSLRRASNLAVSITARGFDAGALRTTYPPLRLSSVELAVLAVTGLVVACVAIVKTCYWLHMAGYVNAPWTAAQNAFIQSWL